MMNQDYKFIFMASKQPFKFFDWKQKLTRFYLRLNKTITHKVLAKSRNALLLNFNPEPQNSSNFGEKLKKNLKKTWEIYELDFNSSHYSNLENFSAKDVQQQFANRQYDAIIVLPNSNTNSSNFHSIQSEEFATDLQIYKKSLFANLVAYRLAHKFLTTSGVLILSNSQSDFAEVQNKTKVLQPDMKNILDAQISYLGVTIGDRDYTDLNSWSVVALSEEFIQKRSDSNSGVEDFIVEMYGNWANGSNLPMPGSFAIFKQEADKKKPFVQYL